MATVPDARLSRDTPCPLSASSPEGENGADLLVCASDHRFSAVRWSPDWPEVAVDQLAGWVAEVRATNGFRHSPAASLRGARVVLDARQHVIESAIRCAARRSNTMCEQCRDDLVGVHAMLRVVVARLDAL